MSRVSRSPRIEFERSHHLCLDDYITALSWSVDGTLIAAISSAGEVAVWDWTGSSPALRAIALQTAAPNAAMSGLSLSSTNLLAAAGQRGTVSVWDLSVWGVSASSSVADPLTLGDGNDWIDQIAWHPSRDYLAFSMGHRVQVWDIPAKQQLADFSFEASSVLGLAWHPSGNQLAVSGHGGVHAWDSTTWEQNQYRLKVPGASISLAWSPDGNYLASGNLDRTLSVLRWQSPPPWLMQGFPGKVRRVAWMPSTVSPAPKLIAVCANGITVWEQDATGKTWRSSVLQGHGGRTVQAIAHHPTQQILASGATDGQVFLWHQSKKLGQKLKGRSRDASGVSPGISCLAWHPTGQHLAVGSVDGAIDILLLSQRGRGFQ